VDFVALERDTLAWWHEKGIVQKYLHRNDASPKRFSFIDGPITANNPMGVHHAWGRMYKDLFQRYKSMQGYKERHQNGFDGQGLWIEVEVEKELGFKSKRDIEAYGIDKFVELCKARVRKFSAIQTQQSVRLGYWMDWDNSYHTMADENNYTIWHFLKTCHERGWLYEGRDVMPWCPRCGTGLSEHEIVTEGYQEIVHPGLFIRFPLLDKPGEALVVWTTTPWTLAANTAAAVHPDLPYVRVKGPSPTRRGETDTIYLAKGRLSVLPRGYEVVEEMKGSALVGLKYRGPFDELPVQRGVEHNVVAWEDVSQEEGTGIVHIAPGAGKEDFGLSKKYGLSVLAPLDEFGDFVSGYDSLTGQNVYKVADAIYASLKEKGLFYRLEKYSHRYPVCWRCNSELVFRLVDEWFISMGELRHLIADVTKKIRWIPEFGLQRELDWLKNMDDWMVSKKRYWGLALPIYKCAACGHFDVIGSEVELKARAVEGWEQFEGHSPHRPWIDAVKVACAKCGATVSRIKDVGNPWLDAGIVPFSTLRYRHDRAYWDQWFPADWISESFPGQFRNWFYSLLTMSTVLENKEPFKCVFSYALMRDEKGQEMHKSKGNAIWFEDAAEKMGVDAMRWLYARQNPAVNLNFGYNVADEVRRQLLIPLWNVYSFFVTYANIDGYDPVKAVAPPAANRAELDRWVLSELHGLVAEVTDALDNYEPDRAARAVEEFVEYLSNWYVRRSRRRFWKSENDEDKTAAYATLYECLVTLIKLVVPIVPFVTEAMYQNLVRSTGAGRESVHLDDYPKADPSLIDQRLTESVRLAMKLSSLGRAARSKAGVKVRQPLQRAVVKLRTKDEAQLLEQVLAQVLDELNLRGLVVADDVRDVVEFLVQPNLPVLGPKYGARLKDARAALAKADPAEVYARASVGQPVTLGDIELLPDEVLVSAKDRPGYAVASEGGYIVAVSTEVTPELAREGIARELVHRIQNMRKSAGFDIADHIVTYCQAADGLGEVLRAHHEYIRQETLSREIVAEAPPKDAYVEEHDLEGVKVALGVRRA
jgi:isoleucyl-tRNA synthetase